MACPCELELAGDGGRRRKGKREGVVCDGGDPCPIYKLEALEAKQTCSGRGRPGPGALDGEVAAGGGGAAHGGRRGKRPSGQGRVWARGEAKGPSRCPQRASWVQLAAGLPWMRSTGGVRASGGGNREGDGDRELSAI